MDSLGNVAQGFRNRDEAVGSQNKIKDGINTGVDTVADIAGAFGPVGQAIGGAAKLLTKIGTAINYGKKLNDYSVSQELENASGFTGLASDAAEAAEMAGKRKVFGRKSANAQIDEMKRLNDKVDTMTNLNKQMQAAVGTVANENEQNNRVARAGGFSNAYMGRSGLKLSKAKSVARNAKNKHERRMEEVAMFQKGGKAAAKVDRLSRFNRFTESLPSNLRANDVNYNMRRLWELNGEPENFTIALHNGNMFTNEQDGYHAASVAYNKDNDTYEFMKSKNHPTVYKEIEWYNGDSDDAKKFRTEYELVDEPDRYYYRRRSTQKFQEGGKINKRKGQYNIIPGGKLHGRLHNIKDSKPELAEQITRKGIPVVEFGALGEVTQHAEIETGELTLRLKAVEKLEKLIADGSDEALIKAGKFLTNEIINKTIDQTSNEN
jgi:hypothetical protein